MNLISHRVSPSLLLAVAVIMGGLWRLEYLRGAFFMHSFRWAVGLEAGFYASNGLFAGVEPEGVSILYRRLLDVLLPLLPVAGVRSLQFAFNYLGVWILWDMFRRDQAFDAKTRWIMLTLLVFYPVPFPLQCELLPESLLFPFAAATLWFFRCKSPAAHLFSGAAAGVMTLLNPLSLALPLALCMIAACRRCWRKSVVLAAGCVILLVTGWFSPGYGIRFASGNRPGASGVCPELMSREWCNAAYASADGTRLSATERIARLASEWKLSPGKGAITLLCKAGWSVFWRDNGREALSEHLVRAVPMVEFGAFIAPFFWIFAGFGIWRVCRRPELKNELDLVIAVAALVAIQLIFSAHAPLRSAMYAALFPLAAIGIAAFDWRKFRLVPLAVLIACVGSYLLCRGRSDEVLARAEWQIEEGYPHHAGDFMQEQLSMLQPEYYRFDRMCGAALLANARKSVMPYERLKTALSGVCFYRQAWQKDNPYSPVARLEYLAALEKLNSEWSHFTGNALPIRPGSLLR